MKAAMQLPKTAAGTVNSGKTAPAPNVPSSKTASTAQNIQSAKPSAQTAKTSPSPPPVLPRSVSSLISSCGLPSDKLSASIISFARFFSLPLKPDLMQDIRRQSFAETVQSNAVKQAAQNAPDSETTAKTREALSLAAAAAESKGVELQPGGLESFAQAVDPDWRRRQDEGRRKHEQHNKDDSDNEEENAPQKAAPVDACDLKKMALESAEKNALLSLLNKLPGKDGRRWIVLPFDFRENGREFTVSFRALLDGGKTQVRAACLALDIAESSVSENSALERRWLFVLEAANGPADRLAVHIQPELPPGKNAALVRELAALLEIKPERVSVNNKAENFPCESGGGGDLLRSINEAV